MRVDIGELREIASRLLAHIESLGFDEVDIPHDYYWTISAVERYDPTLPNVSPSLGQLTEDWDKLRQIKSGALPPVATGLVWLAAVLRATGEQVPG